MNRVFQVIRKVTIPPVFALALLSMVYIFHREYYLSGWQFLGAVFCLVILPSLAYPLQKYIPGFKDKGRDGQRILAMFFSFAGYMLGTIFAFACSTTDEFKIIFLEYLLCGIILLFVNKALGKRASGHACGIVGPVLLLGYFKMYIQALFGIFMIIPVYISSIKTKRHTLPQLIGGSIIPIAVLCVICILVTVSANV